MSGGWFKVHRGWMASFKPEPFTDREAFLWSIEQAAHAPHEQWFNGARYPVERGEFVTSLHAMQSAFGWTEKRVRGLMMRMRKAEKWAMRGANERAKAPTILTVLNYDLYQSRQEDEGEAKGEAPGEGGAKQGRSKGEEQKKGKNGEEEQRRGLQERSPALPYTEAVSIWSEFAKAHRWKPLNPMLTDKRRTGLGKVLSVFGIDGWRQALERAAASELLDGPDPPGWFNFAFLCNLDNFTKTYEGNYDRSFDRDSRQPRLSGWGDIAAAQLGRAGANAQPPQRLLLESGQRALQG